MPKPAVYVAGAWTHREEIDAIIEVWKQQGIRITHEWTKTEEQSSMTTAAINDIQGVRDAKFVVAIMDDRKYAYRGTFSEMGAALALGKPVLIYNPFHANNDEKSIYGASNVFYWHPLCMHFTHIESVFEYICADNCTSPTPAPTASIWGRILAWLGF